MRHTSPILALLIAVAVQDWAAARSLDFIAQTQPAPQPQPELALDPLPEAAPTIVYQQPTTLPPTGTYAPYATAPVYTSGGLCGWCGNFCGGLCGGGVGSCLRNCWARIDACLERCKARLGSLCVRRPRYIAPAYYALEPSCAGWEPSCGFEPGCQAAPTIRLSEPLCCQPEPSCQDIEFSCSTPEFSCGAEPTCGWVAGYRPGGCCERLRSFCQNLRMRMFGWFRHRHTCPYCGQAGCPACGAVLPPEPASEEVRVYELPDEVPSDVMVPVPAVKMQRPTRDEEPQSGEPSEDRVASGLVRLTLNQWR